MKVKNTITFDPKNEESCIIETYPKPSKKYLPNWYKKMPKFSFGDTKLKYPLNGTLNLTLKKCSPFLDAMVLGYMVVLEEDIYVELIDDEPFVRWRTTDGMITWHNPEDAPNLPIPPNYHPRVGKWHHNWTVTVPKNYSVLFTHPLNRIDLPFFTFSGLVSCDKYNNPVNFPFILQKNFEGIIEAGTPICQLSIIKNEPWKTKVLKYDKRRRYKNQKEFFKTFSDSYKNQFRTRHQYD